MWAAYPLNFLKNVGGEKVFMSNVGFKQFKGFESIKSNFWIEVLKIWLENEGAINILKFNENNAKHRPLCNNKDIKYKNETLYLPEAMKRGIVSVEDVIESQNMITFDQYLYKLGGYNSAALDYNIIMNALREEENYTSLASNVIYVERAKELLCLGNKYLRKLINIKNEKQLPLGQLFWERKFKPDVLERYVSTIRSTKETKLRDFIFKIFHNILPTNIMLEK